MSFIYHLVSPKDWQKALNRKAYAPPSLQEEGFIHCSSKEQLLESAQRYFGEETELVVLRIPEKRVATFLKWESSFQGQAFPHLYGKLQFHQIETTDMLYRNQSGDWLWAD